MSGNGPPRGGLYTAQGLMGPMQHLGGGMAPRGMPSQQPYGGARTMQQPPPSMLPPQPTSPSRNMMMMGLRGMSQAPPSPGQPSLPQQRAPVGLPGAGQVGVGGMYMQQMPGQSRLPMSSAVGYPQPSRGPPGMAAQPFQQSAPADDDLDLNSGFPSLSSMGGSFGNNNFGAAKKPGNKFSREPDFSMMQDDFPALPGAKSSKSPDSPSELMGGVVPLSPGGSNLSNFSLRTYSSNSSGFPPSSSAREEDLLGYGLLGMQDVIKMTDADLSMLALGTDLTSLGMNLSSAEPLYPFFASPWADGPLRAKEPNYQLPQCYNIKPVLSPQLFNNLSEETLFYIFYAMPQDSLQLYAANCLFSREWRYHKELKIWLCRAQGVEPIQKTATFERGTFVCFDPQAWKKEQKEMLLQYDALEDRKQMMAPPA